MPRKKDGMLFEVHPTPAKGKYVRLDNVDYNPGQLWNHEMSRWCRGFRRVDKANTQELLANQEQLEAVLHRTLERYHGYVTVGMFAYHSGLTKYSARKQLNRWTEGENPKLLKTRRGKEDIYTEI